MSERVIIIGASLAGISCAKRLLESGKDLHITLISDENDIAYDRPPLSKSLRPRQPLPVVSLDPSEVLKSERLTIFAGHPAQNIDTINQRVELNGIGVPYDKLVIATGARARHLPVFESAVAPVLTLRTLADAKAIKTRLEKNKSPRVGIIGGGFIGLELAASLSESCSIELFEAQHRLLSRILPLSISDRVAQRHQQANVNIHTDAHIVDVQGHKDSVYLELSDTRKYEFDLVVMGVGAIPNTELAEDAGLVLANGIEVNEFLETTAESIYAIGDCCAFPLYTTGEVIRVESWRNAQEQGLHVAGQIITGEKTQYTGIPWFWSDQYDLGIQMAGWPHSESLKIERIDGDKALIFELDGQHRLIAVAGIGPGNSIAKDIKICERLIRQRVSLSVEQLNDSDIDLKQILKSAG